MFALGIPQDQVGGRNPRFALEIEAGGQPLAAGGASPQPVPWYKKPVLLAAAFLACGVFALLVKGVCNRVFGGLSPVDDPADPILEGIGTRCKTGAVPDQCPKNLECVDGSCEVREDLLMEKCAQLIGEGSTTEWDGAHGPKGEEAIHRTGRYAGFKWCGCKMDASDLVNQREIECNAKNQHVQHFIGHSRVNAVGLRMLWKAHPPSHSSKPFCKCVTRPRKELGADCETHEQCKPGSDCRAVKGVDQGRQCMVSMQNMWANCAKLVKGSVKKHRGTDWNENGMVEQGGCSCEKSGQTIHCSGKVGAKYNRPAEHAHAFMLRYIWEAQDPALGLEPLCRCER